MRVFVLMIIVLCCFLCGTAHAKKFDGTVFFNDGSSVESEFTFQGKFSKVTVFYDGEYMDIPTDMLASIELISVEKGKWYRSLKAHEPITTFEFVLKNGNKVRSTLKTFSKPFCRKSFSVLRLNKLTRIKEEKGYNWAGQHDNPSQGNCKFGDVDEEKKVVKVIMK